jgi:hypothetical protein
MNSDCDLGSWSKNKKERKYSKLNLLSTVKIIDKMKENSQEID